MTLKHKLYWHIFLIKEGVNNKQYALFALKLESKISVLPAPLADKTRFATVKSTLMVENSKWEYFIPNCFELQINVKYYYRYTCIFNSSKFFIYVQIWAS